MRVWAHIDNVAGTLQTDGPITTITQATVSRMLDGVGSISLSVPGTDKRSIDLLTNEARAILYVEQLGTIRELGRGIIRRLDDSDNASGWTRTARGPDSLDELKRIMVGINRTYDNQTIATIVADLVGDVSGWADSCSLTDVFTGRFDSVSVLKALQSLVAAQGVHLRQAASGNTLEVGAFGTDSGLTLINASQMTDELYSNDDVALIERFTQSQDSEAVANRIFVYGAGDNVDAALTLELSNRSSPYTIQSRVKNGRTEYYLQHGASVTAYGVIEKYVQFKEISPLGTSDTDKQRAANALYDAAAAWLDRNALPQSRYSVVVRKAMQTIRPGDLVHISYLGVVEREEDGSFIFRDINDDFWVMSCQETVTLDGITLALEVASVDSYEQDAAQVIIGALEQVRLQGTNIQQTLTGMPFGPEQVFMDPSNGKTVLLPISTYIYNIQNAVMRVRTRPLTATATGAASGGGSTETSTATLTTPTIMRVDSSPPGGTPSLKKFTVFDGSSTYFFEANTTVPTPSALEPTNNSSHSHDVTLPAHTHDLNYGIHTDTTRPADIEIDVNGTSVTPSPIGTTGADLDTTIDVTDEINAKAGGIHGSHTIELTCGSGQGEVLIEFFIVATIVPFGFA